jgi:hypothetical protein
MTTDVSLITISASIEDFQDVIKALPQTTEVDMPGWPKCFVALGIAIAAMSPSSFNDCRITELNSEISALKSKMDLLVDVSHFHKAHHHHLEEKTYVTNKLLADLLESNVWFTTKITDTVEKKFQSMVHHQEKEKAKSYKKNLKEVIAIFGDYRDSQLQIEQLARETEHKSAKEVLSDTGSDHERCFQTANEFNRRLDEAAGLTADEPDATVRLPETTQKKDARVHFDAEQGQEARPVGTGQQVRLETNSQQDSSEDTASGDDELDILKQELAMRDYQEKVLREQLDIKERELAEVDLRNRQLSYKLDKERRENLKLSGELQRQSANPDPNARTALPSLARDTGTIPKISLVGSKDQVEQSCIDREVRRLGYSQT